MSSLRSPSGPGPLTDAVSSFISDIAAELGSLTGQRPDTYFQESGIEASNIAGGVFDADGRLTDSEVEIQRQCGAVRFTRSITLPIGVFAPV